ncbi:MAG: prepilin-type N-terminal cleavage/methylation domain-containing protein [Thermodesulfobacteriota bacterium]|nr:prepilin-type N-terminal cleavage/methylation domain-containing protein [Thermodesulfobacteriota bacterium]
MPHPRKKHKKAFTLVELAIVLVIIGLIAVLIFPAITDFIKFGKKTEAKDFLTQVKDKIIGFALMNKRLPTGLSEIGVSKDPYGNDIFYNPDSGLTSGDLCDETSTNLDVDEVDQGGATTTFDDIAFVVASFGRNNHQEFVGTETSPTVTIYDPRYWPSAPGYGAGEYDQYDDIVEYVSLAYLRNKICTNITNQSLNPYGSDVSFAQNMDDFNNEDVANPYGQGPGEGTVKINLEEGTVELGGEVADDRGCLWYQGDNAEGNCSSGKCEINYGVRAYFTFKYTTVDTSASSGDIRSGFTFALIDGDANLSTVCGSPGLYMGYAGASTDPILPRKMAVEVDTYPNPASPLYDPDNNHIAFVYYDGDGGSGDGNRNFDVNHQDLGETVPGASCFDGNRNPQSGNVPTPPNIIDADADAIYTGATAPWLEDGNEHHLRIEIYRNAAATTPGTCDEVFNSTVWIDCTNCTDLTLPWNTTYGTYQAIIQHNCTVGDNATDFRHMRFGWSEGTGGGANQNIVISDFGIKFLNNTPNHPY